MGYIDVEFLFEVRVTQFGYRYGQRVVFNGCQRCASHRCQRQAGYTVVLGSELHIEVKRTECRDGFLHLFQLFGIYPQCETNLAFQRSFDEVGNAYRMGWSSVNHLDVFCIDQVEVFRQQRLEGYRKAGCIQVFFVGTVVVEPFGLFQLELVFDGVGVNHSKHNLAGCSTGLANGQGDGVVLLDLREVGYFGVQQPFAISFGCETF